MQRVTNMKKCTFDTSSFLSDDISLGSGKNGSFDDRTEGSSLHEGNRWLLLLMMMVSVLMMIMVRPLAINDGEANKNDKYEGIFFQSKDT